MNDLSPTHISKFQEGKDLGIPWLSPQYLVHNGCSRNVRCMNETWKVSTTLIFILEYFAVSMKGKKKAFIGYLLYTGLSHILFAELLHPWHSVHCTDNEVGVRWPVWGHRQQRVDWWVNSVRRQPMVLKGMKNAMAYNSGQDVIPSVWLYPKPMLSSLCHTRTQPEIDNHVFRFWKAE